ncbi:MAG: PhoH family protein [Thermodesulfobacteriota bacterium]
MAERRINFHDAEIARELFGAQERNLNLARQRTGAEINVRGTEVCFRGEEHAVAWAASALGQLYELYRSGFTWVVQEMEYALKALEHDPQLDLGSLFRDEVFAVSPKKTISPKTLGQREYLQALRHNDLTFGIGPAGTGKTYLAVAMAVSFLLQRKVKRLILTRPAVEAGEKLGFLPGDMMEKVNPYLRPLYDALHDMLDFRKVREMLEGGVIEVAPLAFMRGRTLNDAVVILDEAQNTTPEQMKMFLTRMGFGSKAVVTGDVTQIDLPPRTQSGLIQALKILENVDGIGVVHFGDRDVIRHNLVGRIVKAYDRYNRSLQSSGEDSV